MDNDWVAIISALAGAGLVGVVTALIKWRKEIFNIKRTDRKDAISEWVDISSRQDKRIVALELEVAKVREQAGLEVARATESEARCREDLATIKGEMRLMQATIQRLQESTGEGAPGSSPAQIVANIDGKIVMTSPAVSPLFYYLPPELIGKNVSMLIPSGLREAHEKGLANVKEMGQPPWPEKIINTMGRRKDGVEIPIAITLTGWQVNPGQWLISAEIRRRRISSSSDSGSFSKTNLKPPPP